MQSADLAAFGSLWVLQFFVLDRWLFRRRTPAPGMVTVPAEPEPLVEQAA